MSYKTDTDICNCCDASLLPALNVSLIPASDTTIDLGSALKNFRRGFFENTISDASYNGLSAQTTLGADVDGVSAITASVVGLAAGGTGDNTTSAFTANLTGDDNDTDHNYVGLNVANFTASGGANTAFGVLIGTGYDYALVAMSGKVGVGLVPTANMVGVSIEAGVVTIKERATPTADVNYGKIYCKDDNKLYFQDGAGGEHEIAYVP